MQVNVRDAAAGAVFMAIGLFFALDALFNLRMGSATSMGPAYFPVMVGFCLTALGAVIALVAIGKPSEAIGAIPWRGVGLVMLSIFFFGATVRGLGMAPGLGISTFFAAIASRKLSWRASAIVAVVITFFSVIAFIYLLGLPYPVIGPWILG